MEAINLSFVVSVTLFVTPEDKNNNFNFNKIIEQHEKTECRHEVSMAPNVKIGSVTNKTRPQQFTHSGSIKHFITF